MPTIVFASPKGGAGKSTSAVVLSCQLAQSGADVVIIDADPNRPVSKWARLEGRPANLAVVADVTEATVIDEIESWAARIPFVVVDLEGTASMTVAYAISRADLVVIPVQGSQLDAAEAAKAIKLIRQQEKSVWPPYPPCRPVHAHEHGDPPRLLGHIREELQAANVPIMTPQMHEREAFRAIFSFGGTIDALLPSQVSNLAAASANARAVAAEIVSLLRPAMPKRSKGKAA